MPDNHEDYLISNVKSNMNKSSNARSFKKFAKTVKKIIEEKKGS